MVAGSRILDAAIDLFMAATMELFEAASTSRERYTLSVTLNRAQTIIV